MFDVVCKQLYNSIHFVCVCAFPLSSLMHILCNRNDLSVSVSSICFGGIWTNMLLTKGLVFHSYYVHGITNIESTCPLGTKYGLKT